MAPHFGSEMRCGLCGNYGHNRRTCGVVKNDPLPVKGQRRCGCCGEVGHNKRTCPKAKVPIIPDEPPMDEDFILSSDEEYEPAVSGDDDIFTPEITTEGYRNICGLDHDVMTLVGEEVGKVRVKINQEWWEGKIHFTSWDGMDKTYFHIIRSRSALGVIGQPPKLLSLFEVDRDKSDGWQQEYICKSIRKLADLLDDKISMDWDKEVICPRYLKYKYIRKEIGTPKPLWKRTLAEREAEITREFYARRER